MMIMIRVDKNQLKKDLKDGQFPIKTFAKALRKLGQAKLGQAMNSKKTATEEDQPQQTPPAKTKLLKS